MKISLSTNGGKDMQLQIRSQRKEDYLSHDEGLIDFNHPEVQAKIDEIEKKTSTLTDRARLAFHFVRDDIQHSFDTNSTLITISASETIIKREGICFAKSHLLAALLRGMGIPAGFCYQRVLRKDTIESGYALHGLNALFLDGKWFRVDPRGNKEGIQSEFSMEVEKLAYPIRGALGEMDYPYVFKRPLESVVHAMQTSEDCRALFFKRPESL